MSKFVTVQTKIQEQEFLQEALKELGCTLKNEKRIKVFLKEQDCDFSVKTRDGLRFGMKQSESGNFDFVGDSMILNPLFKDYDFKNRLTQKYAYLKVMSQAKKAGFKLVKETNTKDNSIKLVLRKW
ncbi:MAG: DUF1257 domain-containing protein [Calditrichaeota bacterium]|nr:MAG: DUF1257 domain-containing protein [Calditrichota bacterium]